MKYLVLICIVVLSACGKEEPQSPPPGKEEMYFPPTFGNTWETTSLEELGWNEAAVPDLENYLELNGTRAFIVLKNGKIVMEKYWNTNITNNGPFDQNSTWYWASAGKTLAAFLTGMAQEANLLSIEDKTSDYLGQGWTNMTSAQENEVKIKHQLMMTTGLDYTGDVGCTIDTCLTYLNDPGTAWYYHNAPYTLLSDVVSNAAGMSFNQYTDNSLDNAIGFDGDWIGNGFNFTYWSTAREAARFGLLLLNDGVWDGTTVLGDQEYLNQLHNTSQPLNEAYGYLTWLNGKSSLMFPSSTVVFPTSLSPNAPADLYAGMGKNGQFVEVVPSQSLVVIRMGQAPDNSLVPITFHDEMWEKINDVIN